MGKIKLIDFIKVNPDPSFAKLSKREKIKLVDSFITKEDNNGLLITYDLSHSGRRINNRIYSTRGQQDGIQSLLNPYPKPILIHHDGDSDPIGRFVRGEWQDLSNQALGFFDDIKDFMQVKNAFLKDDPEQIYSVMKKNNLLTNKEWPGLGRMRVQARISDSKAIEKFLDGRYITFSAGSTTDRHVCSICLTDWAEGDICEHRHGKIYDGEICVFITGQFEVLEGSVVNMPADDLSQVLSMELTDKPDMLPRNSDNCMVDQDTIYLSDSIYKMESIMSETMTEVADTATEKTVSAEVSPKEDTTEVKMETSEVVEETNTDEASSELIKDDKAIEEEESIELQEETSNETLSDSNDGDAVDTATSEETKLDQILDIFNKILNKVEEKKELREVEQDNDNDSSMEEGQHKDTAETKEEAEEKEVLQASDRSEEQRLQEVSETSSESDQDDLDWYLLDAALTLELGDSKLSAEELEQLPDSAFCGPDRSFPVPDSAHINAARKLVDRAKLSASQREVVLNCINKKAEDLGCDSDNLSSEYEALKEDHQVVLKRVEWLEAKLQDLLNLLAKTSSEVLTGNDTSVEKLVESLNDNICNEEAVKTRETVAKIENPSVASSEATKAIDDLGSFEKSVVKQYDKLLSTKGLGAANNYLASKRRYLPRGFHPNKFIGD